jgi:hypothetical protein
MLTFVTLSRYSLDVGVPGGGALIRAPRVWGALHGLETFAQMVQHTKGQGYSILPCHIRDEPRFEYRSVMIDTARHFLNVSTILRVIDSMAINKLNVLQIHLTDDQSFPFDSLTHPNLTKKGAFNELSVYSHADIRLITQHAYMRGISCQFETDMPAHASSWKGERGFLANHTGMPDPSKPSTAQTIADVIGELRQLGASGTHHIGVSSFRPCAIFACTSLSTMQRPSLDTMPVLLREPDNALLSPQGDEVVATRWEADPALMAWARAQHLTARDGCGRSTPSGSRIYNSSVRAWAPPTCRCGCDFLVGEVCSYCKSEERAQRRLLGLLASLPLPSGAREGRQESWLRQHTAVE